MQNYCICCVVVLLAALQLVQNASCCDDGSKLVDETNRILFPKKEYSRFDNENFVNPEWFFKMNNCTPLYSLMEDILLISGSDCDEIPLKVNHALIRSKVSIKWTSMKSIRTNAFSSWNEIYELEISENSDLGTIESGAFNGMTDLHRLFITDNSQLSVLYEHSFKSLINLKVLSMARNGFFIITDITRSLSTSSVPFLEKLDISGNQIVSLKSNDFSMMPANLKEIVLDEIHFDYYDFEIGLNVFDRFTNLKKIILGSAYPTDKILGLLSQLKTHNSLSEIELYNLDLSETSKFLSTVVMNSIYKKVIIKGSMIGQIKDADSYPIMMRAEKLEEIELSDSNIEEFPIILFNSNIFPMVNKIVLRHNQFSYIPNDIPNSPVKLLDLSGNKFMMLEKNCIYFASQLEVLILTDTGLKTIPDNAFITNTRLLVLIINKNNFEQSSYLFTNETFAGLNQLKVLDMSSCKIIEFRNKNVFENLNNLQTLTLKSNHIRYIDADLFKSMTCLRKVDLRNNHFLYLNPSFFNKNKMITDIGLLYDLHKVDDNFINWLKYFDETGKVYKECNTVEILTSCEANAETMLQNSCWIVTNNNLCDIAANETSKIDYYDDANVTYVEEEIDFIYILFRPSRVYNDLSSDDAWSILRFMYVFLFYLIVFGIITFALFKLICCTKKWQRRKRQRLIFDEKTDYCGIENKGFNVPYEKMKDVKLGLSNDKN